MTRWIIKKEFSKLPKLNNPILIEGLPGVGNVGKIAVDFLIDSLNPRVLYRIYSHAFPHSVFLTENNQIELPSVKLYYSKRKKRDFLFLAGDVQPVSERASYEFCEKILDFAQELGCKEIITLGGIGLPDEVKSPTVFGATTDAETMRKYKKFRGVKFTAHERVEAIVGASGLLLGLAQLRNLNGISLLTETYAHQLHFGFKEAKTVLGELKKILELETLDLSEFEKEVISYEQEKVKLEQETKLLKKLKTQLGETAPDTKYIG